jgi:hypothetical protein
MTSKAARSTPRLNLIETEIGTIAPNWKVVPLSEVAEKPQYGLTAKAATRVAEAGDVRSV